MPGPPRPDTGNPTLTPCTHEWRNDDTGYDPVRDEPIPFDDQRAQAAFARGYTQGLAELDTTIDP